MVINCCPNLIVPIVLQCKQATTETCIPDNGWPGVGWQFTLNKVLAPRPDQAITPPSHQSSSQENATTNTVNCSQWVNAHQANHSSYAFGSGSRMLTNHKQNMNNCHTDYKAGSIGLSIGLHFIYEIALTEKSIVWWSWAQMASSN